MPRWRGRATPAGDTTMRTDVGKPYINLIFYVNNYDD